MSKYADTKCTATSTVKGETKELTIMTTEQYERELKEKDDEIASLKETMKLQDGVYNDALDREAALRKTIGKVREYLDEKVKGPSFPFFPHVVKDIKALLAEEK